jgi:Na+-translocating ferredoxin:NAD+ oxidoreductase subunit B
MDQMLAESIDCVLPQTQCTRCGYPDCRSYAHAIAADGAAVNRCPPGGDALIRRLAVLTARAYAPLDPTCGVERPRHVAVIDEPQCIGCTLCIRACPVDAIVGAPGHMHTVITELCTGCDLCIAPCPVDCIAMVPAIGVDTTWDAARADDARRRYEARRKRHAHDAAARAARLAAGATKRTHLESASSPEAKRAAIAAAFDRARARRRAHELSRRSAAESHSDDSQ